MIVATDVVASYSRATKALAGVDLTAESGKVVGLIGPNGSGKSTLLRTLHAAMEVEHGTITIGEVPVAALPPRERARLLAVVVQEASYAPTIRVADLVLLGRAPHVASLRGYSRADYEIAAAALTKLGIRSLADRELATLSGGERQRALIARAIAQQADYLLLDEPTNHLDIRYQHETLELVRELARTTVVVLHDLNLAAQYCDDLVLLDQGQVVASGPAEQVLTPELLEPVYGLSIERVDRARCCHLLFSSSR